MPEPRVSVLTVAKNEAHNIGDCLRAASWADERVVVVDQASRDATREIAEKMADVVIVRPFDDFASQRNCGLEAASGDWVLSIDADERATPALAEEVRRVIGEAGSARRGFRVPIRSVILGRPFGYSGTQHDLPLRLFRRGSGRWIGLVHETVELEGPCGTLKNCARASYVAERAGVSEQDRSLHDAGSPQCGRRAARFQDKRRDAAAGMDIFQALYLQARISRRG